ncbi:hypothetical protein Tco_0169015 [Tanacetum coccineum]
MVITSFHNRKLLTITQTLDFYCPEPSCTVTTLLGSRNNKPRSSGTASIEWKYDQEMSRYQGLFGSKLRLWLRRLPVTLFDTTSPLARNSLRCRRSVRCRLSWCVALVIGQQVARYIHGEPSAKFLPFRASLIRLSIESGFSAYKISYATLQYRARNPQRMAYQKYGVFELGYCNNKLCLNYANVDKSMVRKLLQNTKLPVEIKANVVVLYSFPLALRSEARVENLIQRSPKDQRRNERQRETAIPRHRSVVVVRPVNTWHRWDETCLLDIIVIKSTNVVEPLPPAHKPVAEPDIVAQWTTLYDAHTEIAFLMLGSMTPELHRQFELYYLYDMIHELRSMFEKQAGIEKFDLIQSFHACKQEEGKSVADYVLKMKGYVEKLERLGYVLP